MEGAHIECGRRITDSLIERRVRILSSDQSLPKVHRLVRGDLLLEKTLEEAVHRGPTTTGSGAVTLAVYAAETGQGKAPEADRKGRLR